MAGVDHHQAEARPLGHRRSLSPGVDNVVDHLLGHLVDLLAGGQGQIAGAVGRALAGGVLAADAGQACVHAAVRQLDVGHGSAAVDRVHRAGEAGENVGIVHGHLPVMTAAGGGVHDALAQGNHGGTAGGLAAVIGHVVIREMALRGKTHHAGGGCKDAVF